jgi:DNA invertase Pin-like site-specific DNA recombinase
MNTSELITAQHLARQAIVYIRQSTSHQVLTNQESLELQYALKQRALDLGWGTDNIQIIDTDLGLTGASAEKREGFKEILTKVTLGHVGIILSYDVTRLSRNCSDWYPLLDICGYKQCLIADRDGIYDAGTTNGRLLLGLKGQLAEMELSTIKARLTAGLLNKAKRGDLALRLPIGLVRDAHNRVHKDPNIEVQNRIVLIFETFLEKKTAAKVLRYFNEHHLTIPRYNRFGELQWKEPTLASIVSILRTPTYAGAFTYGRTRTTRNLPTSDKTTRKVPMEEWKVLIKDKHPKYIEWETFEKIQSILKDNYAEYDRNKSRGVPRQGAALLQGIMYCGKCGHKMVVQYKGGNRYLCNYLRQQRLMPVCQHLPADVIDSHVILQFFEALKPIELDAYTQATHSQKSSEQKLEKAYKQQLDRLKYEAKLAERQFHQVDPDNRLVAAELERRWEDALKELREAESTFEQKKKIKCEPPLSSELKEAFLNVGKNLPLIWDKSILSRQQKKAFLRCLIDKIVAHKILPDCLQVRIVWKGGATTTFQIPITVGSFYKLSDSKEMEKTIIKLSKNGKTDPEIAEYLTQQGYRSPLKKHVLVSTVQIIRLKHRIFITKYQSHPLKVKGYLTVTQTANIIGVTPYWIYDRINNGQIKITKNEEKAKGKYLFKDTQKTVKMFKGLKSGKFKNLNFLQGYQHE